MTALSALAKRDKIGDDTFPHYVTPCPAVEAATTLWSGGLAALNAAGNIVPASANPALKVLGVSTTNVVAMAAAGIVALYQIEIGAFPFSTDVSMTSASIGANVYAVDDNTVSLSDLGGQRPLAGYVQGIMPNGQAVVQVGQASPYAAAASAVQGPATYRARNVVTTNVAALASYTVAAADTNDNVLNVAGDVVLLLGQTTAAQNGPYVVGTVNAGVAPLTRPDWWVSGSKFSSGAFIALGGEGQAYSGFTFTSLAAAGIIDTNDPIFRPDPAIGQAVFRARGAVGANVASLAAFTVAGNDGITYVQGDVVVLLSQTTAAQNGPYVVGAVNAGVAPLRRPWWFATGTAFKSGQIIEVGSEGTAFKGATLKGLAASGLVDTNDAQFYARVFKKTITLAAGTYTIGAGGGLELIGVFAALSTMVQITRNTAANSSLTTGGYACITRTPGVPGVGALVINAQVAAGTINNADTSTLDILATNW